jgi:hypothetical protein
MRRRFAEDGLAETFHGGICQHVLLGEGLKPLPAAVALADLTSDF